MKAKMLEALEKQLGQGTNPDDAWVLKTFTTQQLLLVHKFVCSFYDYPRPRHEMG